MAERDTSTLSHAELEAGPQVMESRSWESGGPGSPSLLCHFTARDLGGLGQPLEPQRHPQWKGG